MRARCRCQACRGRGKEFMRWSFIFMGLAFIIASCCGCGKINLPCFPGINCPAPTPSPTPAPTPTPTPTPVPIPTPAPTPDRGDDILPCYTDGHEAPEEKPQFAKDVDEAITFACPFVDCPTGTFVEDWRAYIKLTRRFLQAGGYLAAYDWQHGDDGLGSELSVWKSGRIESYQIVTSRIRTRRPPGAFRWGARVVDCELRPSCDLVVSQAHPVRFKIAEKMGGAGARWLDLTPEYFYGVNEDGTNAGPCGDPNTHAPRRWCDLGVDGGPQGIPCQDTLVGVPQWSSRAVELETPFRGNSFLARIVSGFGWVEVCGEHLLPQGEQDSHVKVCLNWEVK